MYKVLTENGEYKIEFLNNNIHETIINKENTGCHIKGNLKDGFNIEKDGTVYLADVLRINYKEKSFLLKVNGERIKVKVQDRFDLLLLKLGITELATKKINQLKSPMPGLILEILVSPGQAIKTGEPMLILEAMKMENIIKSPADVVIKNIKVIKGKAVEKNELLIDFE